MSLHISLDCFGISIDCFGLSRIRKWMILIITVNLSTGIISVNTQLGKIRSVCYRIKEADFSVWFSRMLRQCILRFING